MSNPARCEAGSDRDVALIREQTFFCALPLCPQIEVRLLKADSSLWNGPVHLFDDRGPRPYWAFAWGSGQALARYVLDHPQLVRSKRVLDFGSGCGVAAIACASAGASVVTATEIDPLAVRAIEMNAVHNGVADRVTAVLNDEQQQPLGLADEPWDVLLAGDVFYLWPQNAALSQLADGDRAVLFGMPAKRGISRDQLEEVGRYAVRTVPDIEHPSNTESCVMRVRCGES